MAERTAPAGVILCSERFPWPPEVHDLLHSHDEVASFASQYSRYMDPCCPKGRVEPSALVTACLRNLRDHGIRDVDHLGNVLVTSSLPDQAPQKAILSLAQMFVSTVRGDCKRLGVADIASTALQVDDGAVCADAAGSALEAGETLVRQVATTSVSEA